MSPIEMMRLPNVVQRGGDIGPRGRWNVAGEITVGSIRHLADVNEALQAGADIVTVLPKDMESIATTAGGMRRSEGVE